MLSLIRDNESDQEHQKRRRPQCRDKNAGEKERANERWQGFSEVEKRAFHPVMMRRYLLGCNQHSRLGQAGALIED